MSKLARCRGTHWDPISRRRGSFQYVTLALILGLHFSFLSFFCRFGYIWQNVELWWGYGVVVSDFELCVIEAAVCSGGCVRARLAAMFIPLSLFMYWKTTDWCSRLVRACGSSRAQWDSGHEWGAETQCFCDRAWVWLDGLSAPWLVQCWRFAEIRIRTVLWQQCAEIL